MSTIRLSGTSSGYYDLTVPAAAGTNSIDLSNLAVKNSSGQLGLGTNSPAYLLNLEQAVNQVPFLYIKNTGNDGCHNAITLESSTTADKNIGIRFINSGGVKGGIGYAQSGKIALYGNTDTNKGVNVNGNGHVTLPSQPYFYATGTATGTQLSTNPCPYNQTSSNIGGHYNTSNYTFTAPVDGRYLFTVSALNYPSASSSGEMYFSVNGGGYTALMRFHNIGSQQSITGSAIINLSANDTVKVIGSLYFYTSGGHGHFSGMLMG
jgi:hypothetical protein